MGPAIENVHERDWKNIGLFGPCKVGDMGVERDILSFEEAN